VLCVHLQMRAWSVRDWPVVPLSLSLTHTHTHTHTHKLTHRPVVPHMGPVHGCAFALGRLVLHTANSRRSALPVRKQICALPAGSKHRCDAWPPRATHGSERGARMRSEIPFWYIAPRYIAGGEPPAPAVPRHVTAATCSRVIASPMSGVVIASPMSGVALSLPISQRLTNRRFSVRELKNVMRRRMGPPPLSGLKREA
jgi:hypothetical protein